MIHLNALGLILQQPFSVLTTKSGSSSLTTGQITLNWTNYPVPTQVLLSSLSRISSHAMAYLILCILTTDHNLLPENSKNLNPLGILTTKRPHHTIHNQMARLKEEVTNQSKSKWTRSILGHFGLAQHTFTQYWIITSTKIVWTTHKDTVTYSRNFVTAKDHGGNWRQAQRKKDETSTVLQQRNKRASWASTRRHSAHETAAIRQRKQGHPTRI